MRSEPIQVVLDGLRRRPVPVSYTHLDVYKRQVLAFEKLKPSAKKLDIMSNLKNIFSKKNLVELLKSVIKIAFLSALVTLVVRDALPELMAVPHLSLIHI